MTIALMAIAIISFFVWAHHMFVAGISIYSAVVFSLISFFVAVPSAIKVFNWTVSLHKGSIVFDAPMIYALGFVLLFTIGGLTGLMVATLAIDVHVHDTYFVIAHFHYIMVGGTVSAFFGALHYWWPKMTGRFYPESWARFAAAPDLHRLQPDIFPAIHSRLLRNAAAMLYLSAASGNPGTFCPRPAPRSWPSLMPCRYSISAGHCSGAGGPMPTRGGRPVSNGRPRRRRRPTIGSMTPIVKLGPYSYDPEDGSYTTQDGIKHAA